MTTSDTTSEQWEVMEISASTPLNKRGSILERAGRIVSCLANQHGAKTASAVFWTQEEVSATPLNRKLGFWTIGRKRRLSIPPDAETSESHHETVTGMRFVGRVDADADQLGQLLQMSLSYQRNRSLVFVPLSPNAGLDVSTVVSALSKATFEYALANSLLEAACRADTVVMIPTGRFDDAKTGAFVVAPLSWRGQMRFPDVDR